MTLRPQVRHVLAGCALFMNTLGSGTGLPGISHTYIPNLPSYARAGDVFQDSRGLIWIGHVTYNRGLHIYDGTYTRNITARPEDSTALAVANVAAFAEASDGRIWIGGLTPTISIYDRDTDRFSSLDMRVEVAEEIDEIWYFMPEGNDVWWIACIGGLLRYDHNAAAFQHYWLNIDGTEEEKLHANSMFHLLEDPTNPDLIWIATRLGLISFDKTTHVFTRHPMPYSAKEEAGHRSTQYLLLDIEFLNTYTIAAGSWSGGMMFYDIRSGQWRRKRDESISIGANVYYDIETRNEDEIWIGSTVGFGIFNMTDSTFQYYDSIPSAAAYGVGTYASAIEHLNDRDMVVVGRFGGAVIHFSGESAIGEKTYPPVVRRVSIANEVLRVQTDTYTDRTIHLSPIEDEVNFQIVSPTYYQADSMYYRYRLTGVDQTWNLSRGRTEASYAKLGRSRYTLQYQASHDGVTWVDGQPWTIIKYQPWWHSNEVKYVIAGAILGGLLLYFYLVSRQKRKRAELESHYRHLLAESEMAALRAQMNPHFIFNSLNSIKMHVMKQDTAVANHYLTRFSHLMRVVLRNSRSKLVTLADELNALELYTEIEKLRFDDGFDSEIRVEDEIDTEAYYIPPMLLQPYVENAIWHGLLHKKQRGHLHIDISLHNSHLHIAITDNGMGRAYSEKMQKDKAKLKKSYGTRITQDRVELIRQSLNIHASVSTEDLYDQEGNPAGTRVQVRFPCINPKQAQQLTGEVAPKSL